MMILKQTMISCGLLLAAFVFGAAAQEEKTAPVKLEDPPWIKDIAPRRIVYSVPGMEKIKARKNLTYRSVTGDELKADVYSPPKARRGVRLPAVIFIHGGALPPNLLTKPKEWGVYVSYGQLIAASGFVGVTFNHRYYGDDYLDEAQSDVDELIKYVRSNADALGVDNDRIFVWAFSAGGIFLSHALRDAPDYIRGIIAYYPVLDLLSLKKEVSADRNLQEFSPLYQLTKREKMTTPLLISRAGLDNADLNRAVEDFVRAATTKNANLDFINHGAGQHGFDVLNNDDRSREIIKRTLEFIKTHS